MAKTLGFFIWGMFLPLLCWDNIFAGNIKLLRSDRNSCVIRANFTTPKFIGDKVILKETSNLSNPGEPALPVVIIPVAIPPGSNPKITYETSGEIVYPEHYIEPAESLTYTNEERDEYKIMRIENKNIYNVNKYWHSEYAYIGDIKKFRSQYIAEISIFPLQFNPVRRIVKGVKEITIRVNFGNASKQGKFISEGLMEKPLRSALINYNRSISWRKKEGMRKSQSPWSESPNWIKITVNEQGIYKLTGRELEQVGVELSSIDIGSLALFSLCVDSLPTVTIEEADLPFLPIPYEAVGLTDSSFNRDDYILFYTPSYKGWRFDNTGNAYYFIHPFDTKWCYWLTWQRRFHGRHIFHWGGDYITHNIRLNSPPYKSTSITIGSSWTVKHYESDIIWQTGIRWIWDEFNNDTQRDFYFIDPYITSGDSAIIEVGGTPSAVYIDGLSTVELNPYSSFLTFSLIDNSVISMDFLSGTILDWYNVKYKRELRADNSSTLLFLSPSLPGIYTYNLTGFSSGLRLYDISDSYNPIRILGNGSFTDSVSTQRMYFASDAQGFKTPIDIEKVEINDLWDSDNSADLIILTSDQLDCSSLAQHHRIIGGLRVKVVKLSDVINQFGFGINDPGAIRAFALYAYLNWQEPAPSYLLLVGDGHYDYRGILNASSNLMPPAGKDVHFSDDWFVRFENSSRGFPFLSVGRLPAKNQRELDIMTEKITTYTSHPEYSYWKNTIVLAGDDEYVGRSGTQVEHTLQTDQLASHIYPLADIRYLYMVEYPMRSNLTKPEAREDLITLWKKGALVVNYIGHGNYHLWAHEILFDANSDVARLNNGKRLPLMFSGSCSVGEFYMPFRESTSEKLIRKENGGSIASIAATGLTGSDANYSLNSRLFDALFLADTTYTMGLSLLTAKLAGGGSYSSNDGQYLLMGDPAVKLALPEGKFSELNITPNQIIPISWINASGRIEEQTPSNLWFYVYDSKITKTYTLTNGTTITYHKSGNSIYRTGRKMPDGSFSLSFFVPREVSYNTDEAKIIAYGAGEDKDYLGGITGLTIPPSATPDFIDTVGPEISIWLDDPSFISGDTVSSIPLFHADISDPHGINITASLGHSIYLSIDSDKYKYDLTELFNYYEGDSSAGFVEHKLDKLESGEHTGFFRVWDNLDNSSSVSFTFYVIPEETSYGLVSVLPYPNPFKDNTYITFRLLTPGEIKLDIFTLTGRKVWSCDCGNLNNGYNQILWDGENKYGHEVGNGVYIYRLSKTNGEKEYVIYGKLSKEK